MALSKKHKPVQATIVLCPWILRSCQQESDPVGSFCHTNLGYFFTSLPTTKHEAIFPKMKMTSDDNKQLAKDLKAKRDSPLSKERDVLSCPDGFD